MVESAATKDSTGGEPFRNAFAGNPNGVNRIIEQGDIFFFYRSRVGTDAVDELT